MPEQVVMLDRRGNITDDVKFEEFTNYKLVKINDTFYVWESDYFGPTHFDIAESYTNGDLSKIKCAGSFSYHPGSIHFRSSDYYSMTIRRAVKTNTNLGFDDIKEFASIIGVEPYDSFLEEKIV